MAAAAPSRALTRLAGAALQPLGEERVEVAGRDMPMRATFPYDIARWGLRGIVADFFGTDALETLHLDPRWNPHEPGHRLPSNQVMKNSWDVSKTLRAAVIERCAPLLRSLVFDCVQELVGPIRSCQELAMMRVNFHGSRAILRFHNDREYGQLPRVVNLWLPITRVHGSNSMYVESSPGRSDFAPVELDYGQAFLFYGTELLHGTLDNLSGGTRITFDFRFSL